MLANTSSAGCKAVCFKHVWHDRDRHGTTAYLHLALSRWGQMITTMGILTTWWRYKWAVTSTRPEYALYHSPPASVPCCATSSLALPLNQTTSHWAGQLALHQKGFPNKAWRWVFSCALAAASALLHVCPPAEKSAYTVMHALLQRAATKQSFDQLIH